MNKDVNEEISLKEYINIIYSRIRVVIAGILLTLILVGVYTFTRKPLYEASTTIRVDQNRESNILFGDYTQILNQDVMQTEIAMIKSRSLSERVVKNLNLNVQIKKKKGDFDVDLVGLSLDREYFKGRIKFLFNSDTSFIASIKGKKIFEGKINDKFDFNGIHFILTAKGVKRGNFFIVSVSDVAHRALGLSNSIKVAPVKDAMIMKVTVYSHVPALAAKIANSIANEYIVQSVEYERSDARNTRIFIEKQLKSATENLKEAENALRDYKEKEKFVILDENAKDYISNLSDFESQKAQFEMDITAQEMIIKNIQNQMTDSLSPYNRYKKFAAIPSLSGNTTIQELQNKLMELEMKRSELLQEYTERHPEVIAINGQIEDIKKDISDIVKNVVMTGPSSDDPIYQNLMSTIISAITKIKADSGSIRALNKIIGNYNHKLSKLPEKEVTLAQLMRKKNVNDKIYTMLLTKLEEAKINEAKTTAPVRIVDSAIIPTSPIKPRKRLNMIMALFLGVFIGIGGAFLVEYLDNTIKSPDIIEDYFKLPFLGIIPYINGNDIKKNEHYKSKTAVKNKLITQYAPESPITEAYRVIRTNLQFASIDNPLKSILVTGVQPEDGKTTTVCNIAITYANMGLKTVVVDTDLRKPQVHRMFGLKNQIGISNYLIEKKKISDIVQETDINNLSIVAAGKIKGNFGEILNSDKMKKFIQSMSEKFDIVLYDSPPVLSVADPLILGSQMDGVILVVRYGVTDKDAIMHVKKIISQHSTKLIGVLLNANRNYHSRGYKYYYYDYYSANEKRKKNIIQKLIERI